ncbi:MAG: TIM barrel protein [Nostoc sp.]
MFIVNTGVPPKSNVVGAIDIITRELRNLSDFAASHSVRIALEPLNATAMNTETAIWTISQALDIVDAVDRSNVGICLDLWNNWQDARIEDEIRRADDRIFVLQVSNWRTPHSSGRITGF